MLGSWAISDANRRHKNSFFVFCAVIFFFPWGLIAWLLFRPDVHRHSQVKSNPIRPRLKSITLSKLYRDFLVENPNAKNLSAKERHDLFRNWRNTNKLI